MSQEEAMTRYVDEMKKVLSETYPDGYQKEEVNANQSFFLMLSYFIDSPAQICFAIY